MGEEENTIQDNPQESGRRFWHFCEVCGMLRLNANCFLVISRFADDSGKICFAVAKQYLCVDESGKFGVKYAKNAIRFYSLRTLREAAAMLQGVADKYSDKP